MTEALPAPNEVVAIARPSGHAHSGGVLCESWIRALVDIDAGSVLRIAAPTPHSCAVKLTLHSVDTVCVNPAAGVAGGAVVVGGVTPPAAAPLCALETHRDRVVWELVDRKNITIQAGLVEKFMTLCFWLVPSPGCKPSMSGSTPRLNCTDPPPPDTGVPSSTSFCSNHPCTMV